MMTLMWGLLALVFAERLLKVGLVARFFQRESHQPTSLARSSTRVSVLQPILSGDPTLYSCLEANLVNARGVSHEFLWLIDDDDVEGQRIARELTSRFPEASVRVLLTARAEEGCSPKIHKLIIGAAEAQGEVIVVLDDDTILPVGGLAQTTRELAESRVGLVFGLPYYGCFLNIWSSMLAAFVNAHSLLTYIPPSFFIPPFTINGMFYGCRREALESVGGFDTLRHGLCDDFTVAQLFIKAGWTLKQMSLRHEIRTFVRDRAHYMGVMRRWLVFPQVSIMRQLSCRDLVWFHGLIMLPTVLPLLIVLVGVFCGTMSGLVLVAAFLVVDTLLAACINRLWLFQITPRWRLPLLALSRVLLPIHFALSMTGKRQINWRGHVMNVTADGRFRIVQRR